jgi:catechol 2,3-dioxygenase-like lactoylglutathione lyase family enzyme
VVIPALARILETALYVDDLPRARAFYEGLFGLRAMFADGDLVAYDVGGASVLLLFRRGGSIHARSGPAGTIPGHDGSGPLHFAFAIPADALEAWRARLAERGVAIEATMRWPRGGTSLYFRDPDGHLVELATPGLWPTY